MAGQGFNAQPPPRLGGGGSNIGNQLYVGNVRLIGVLDFPASWLILIVHLKLPYQAGWQDLKDLFRAAGNIVRADINFGVDGRPKGSGTVIFETQKDAQQAISTCDEFVFF